MTGYLKAEPMEAPPPRRGEPMGMASGRVFYPLDPRVDEVDLKDICGALANLCRFGGRCSTFYSVAQHCLSVSQQIAAKGYDADLQLAALLHDAAEAYVGDVIRPIKGVMWIGEDGATLERFSAVEDRILRVIFERVGCPWPTPLQWKVIHAADDVALATEARDLMGDPRWPGLPAPLPLKLTPYSAPAMLQAYQWRLSHLIGVRQLQGGAK